MELCLQKKGVSTFDRFLSWCVRRRRRRGATRAGAGRGRAAGAGGPRACEVGRPPHRRPRGAEEKETCATHPHPLSSFGPAPRPGPLRSGPRGEPRAGSACRRRRRPGPGGRASHQAGPPRGAGAGRGRRERVVWSRPRRGAHLMSRRKQPARTEGRSAGLLFVRGPTPVPQSGRRRSEIHTRPLIEIVGAPPWPGPRARGAARENGRWVSRRCNQSSKRRKLGWRFRGLYSSGCWFLNGVKKTYIVGSNLFSETLKRESVSPRKAGHRKGTPASSSLLTRGPSAPGARVRANARGRATRGLSAPPRPPAPCA